MEPPIFHIFIRTKVGIATVAASNVQRVNLEKAHMGFDQESIGVKPTSERCSNSAIMGMYI